MINLDEFRTKMLQMLCRTQCWTPGINLHSHFAIATGVHWSLHWKKKNLQFPAFCFQYFVHLITLLLIWQMLSFLCRLPQACSWNLPRKCLVTVRFRWGWISCSALSSLLFCCHQLRGDWYFWLLWFSEYWHSSSREVIGELVLTILDGTWPNLGVLISHYLGFLM